MECAEKQLKKLRKSAKADRRFQRDLWIQLSNTFDQEYPALRVNWSRFVAVPAAVAVVFVTMGVGSYAYASPSVTDEHMLYPIKTGIERVEAVWPRSENGTAQFHARMMERRIAEGEVMIRGEGVPPEHLEGIMGEFTLSIDHLEQAEDQETDREPVIKQLMTQTVRYEYLIEAHVDEPPVDLFTLRSLIEGSELSAEEKELLLEQIKLPTLPEDFERPEGFEGGGPFGDRAPRGDRSEPKVEAQDI